MSSHSFERWVGFFFCRDRRVWAVGSQRWSLSGVHLLVPHYLGRDNQGETLAGEFEANLALWLLNRVWYPNIQFTFRYVDQAGQINVWKSTTATNFVAAPPTNSGTPLDKRSCKSDQFSITVDPAHPDRYTIVGKYDDEVDVSIVYERLAEGWKLGSGARGGMTYFGDLAASSVEGAQPDLTSGSDGYAVHRFWPRCAVSGILRIGQSVVDLTDARGIFVHAIQGMRPDTLAARWNFANFQSSTVGGQGVSLTMMEFRTTSAYGEALINIGSVVVGDKLVAITSGGSGLASDHGGSSAEHLDSKVDVETEYAAPGKIAYAWQGHSLATDLTSRALPTVAALVLDLELDQTAETYESRGLIEKVDVLGQVPYLIKKFVSYAVGTKPFIYTVCGIKLQVSLYLIVLTRQYSLPNSSGSTQYERPLHSLSTLTTLPRQRPRR